MPNMCTERFEKMSVYHECTFESELTLMKHPFFGSPSPRNAKSRIHQQYKPRRVYPDPETCILPHAGKTYDVYSKQYMNNIW
jgi:hypothetical protein